MTSKDLLTSFLHSIPIILPAIAGAIVAYRRRQKQKRGELPPDPVPDLDTAYEEDGADIHIDDDLIIEKTDDAEAEDSYEPCTCDRAQRYLHILDPGHDRVQAGKRSPKDENGQRFMEYEFNQDIASRVAIRLQEEGVAYHVLVPDPSFRTHTGQRARMANALQSDIPKLYHSLHANAGPAPNLDTYTADDVGGIEVWHAASSTRGRRMAAISLRHYAAVPLIVEHGIRNRGLRSKTSGQFTVLVNTEMPAELDEAPFYNNRFERKLMMTDEFRQQWSEAKVQAILEMERDGI